MVVFRIARTLVSESLVVCETMGNGSQPLWIATDPILQGSLLRDVLHHHLSVFSQCLMLLIFSDVLKDLRQTSRVGQSHN